MSDLKKNLKPETLAEVSEVTATPGDVTYHPCNFCGSMDYDLSEGVVTDDNHYYPLGCDCCGFGLREPSSIMWH